MNEDELRKQIKEILQKDPTIKRVDDKHGGVEFGIDLVFEREDPFGEVRKYGIQIKIGDINARIAKDIIAQLLMAFGHPFPPDERSLDGVYVVTNGEINSYAQEQIKAARVGFREIHFIDGQILERFLQRGKAKIYVLREG